MAKYPSGSIPAEAVRRRNEAWRDTKERAGFESPVIQGLTQTPRKG